MNTKHTPLVLYGNALTADDPVRVGFTIQIASMNDDLDCWKEYAEFIVTACNAHYELVAACKAALPYLECCEVQNEHDERDESAELAKQLKAAIAKAEGKGI